MHTRFAVNCDTVRNFFTKSKNLLSYLRKNKNISEREAFLERPFNLCELDNSAAKMPLNSTMVEGELSLNTENINDIFTIDSELNESSSSVSSFCEKICDLNVKEKQGLKKKLKFLNLVRSKFLITKLKNECKELKSQYNVNKREIRKKEKIEMLLEENSFLEDSIENLKNKLQDSKEKRRI